MKSRILYSLIVMFFATGVSVNSYADHWTGAQQVMHAAHEFHTSASNFHHTIHHMSGYSHLAHDAHKLAESARHFHKSVENGASYNHAVHDYQKLKQSYHHLEHAYQQAHGSHHNWAAQWSFWDLKFAAEDLHWEMTGG